MKTGKMFVMTCVLSVLLLCTLGAVFDLQDNTANTTDYFAASAQDGNDTYNYTYGNWTPENWTMPWEGACCVGSMCLIPIIVWIIFFAIAIWVYKDAEKRGKSGALWLIIVLLTGIIGLIIWLVVRPKQTAEVGYGPPRQAYQTPPPAQPSPPYQPPYQAPPAAPAVQICPTCGKPATYIQQYNRWYCYSCRKYL
jgi:hypothetical protein